MGNAFKLHRDTQRYTVETQIYRESYHQSAGVDEEEEEEEELPEAAMMARTGAADEEEEEEEQRPSWRSDAVK